MHLIRRIAAALTFTMLLAGQALAGVPEVDLSVTKSDSPDPVLAGSNVTYTITVQNLGPQDASNVSLTDAVPANTTFVSATPPGGWLTVTPPVGGTGIVNATKAALTVADGAQVFTLVVNVNPGPPDGTILSNTASVTSSEFDDILANNSDTEQTTVIVSDPLASVPDAAMPELDTSSPLVILSFAAVLVGLLGVLALVRARRSVPPLR